MGCVKKRKEETEMNRFHIPLFATNINYKNEKKKEKRKQLLDFVNVNVIIKDYDYIIYIIVPNIDRFLLPYLVMIFLVIYNRRTLILRGIEYLTWYQRRLNFFIFYFGLNLQA